jgi:hypothetical protein
LFKSRYKYILKFIGNQTPFSLSISESNKSIAIGTVTGNIYVLGIHDIVTEIVKEKELK